MGLITAFSYLPRPPKKIFLKVKLVPNKVIIGPEYFLLLSTHGPIALSRTCPHLGCTVNYDPEENIFICPCHQSRFTLLGRYISGPAHKDLKPLKLKHTDAGFILEIA